MAEPGRVIVESDVVFAKVGDRELKLDVYVPPEEKRNGAAVLLLHGGAWRVGDKSQLRGYGILVGREGYVCVASEYRLLPEPWPAQIQDAKAALRWMRANAERLRIDPTKIAVEGNSAGAHLALMIAGTPDIAEFDGDANGGVPSDVAAVIAIYAPVLLSTAMTGAGAPMAGMFAGFDDGEAAAAAASPLNHVSATFPPTLLIHGTNDATVPVLSSIKMYDALAEAGVPVDLHLLAQQPHAFDANPPFGRLCVAEMLLFLSRYVLGTVQPRAVLPAAAVVS